jgi:F-box protein 33
VSNNNPFVSINSTSTNTNFVPLKCSFNYNSNDFTKLPTVALTKIFSNLNLRDKLNAAQTCRLWESAVWQTPSLWQDYKMTIYLCDPYNDRVSARFKTSRLGCFVKTLLIKFDINNEVLLEEMANLLEILTKNNNLNSIKLEPIFNIYTSHLPQTCNEYISIDNIKKKIFKHLKEIIMNSRSMSEVSLGFLTDHGRFDYNLVEILETLSVDKHVNQLESLNIGSVNANSCAIDQNFVYDTLNERLMRNNQITRSLEYFTNLKVITLDFDQVTNELINQISINNDNLNKMNINVNSITPLLLSNQIEDESWLRIASRNKNLRVSFNFLSVEESTTTENQIITILSPSIPLETLRMYFCKSLNSSLLQYLSMNFCETLCSLYIVDVICDPVVLHYHTEFNNDDDEGVEVDPDPDPLVLLCWKCRHLQELVIVGYQIYEINITAIAKLRDNLKVFYVPIDCIVEDEESEDIISDTFDYGKVK